MIKYLKKIKEKLHQKLFGRSIFFNFRRMISQTINPILPELICIDVGASYYPHGNWWLFLNSPKTNWVAVEPNKNNLHYLDNWKYSAKVKAVTSGLSRYGGSQQLFVTNVDSGSSLLEPIITYNMKHRVGLNGDAYFFPYIIKEIETKTLESVIEDANVDRPIFVKLDTQGTELSILKGAELFLNSHSIIGVEIESTLLAKPLMNGAGKFWEVCKFLEDKGFELLDLNPYQMPSTQKTRRSKGKRCLNECDAVFAIRRDLSEQLPIDHQIALLGFYITYGFFEEALSMLDNNLIISHLNKYNMNVRKINRLLAKQL